MRQIILLLALIISACQANELRPEFSQTPNGDIRTKTSTASTTGPPEPTSQITGAQETPTDQQPPTPIPVGCEDRTGQVLRRSLDDDRLIRPIEYRVYLPPCYEETADQEYPVLFLLHGLQQTDALWDDLGADERMDELIADGAIPPLILVMPWEQTGIDIEEAVIQVLLPEVESDFRTCQSMDCRGIGGISRGAGWAITIALRNPGVFRFVGLHSPAVINGPVYWSRWVKAMAPDQRPTIWVDIGSEDTLYPITAGVIEDLNGLGLSVRSSIREGNHSQTYWMENMADYLKWYAHTLSYRLD